MALSGPLTRDTWLGHPSRSGPWLPGSQCPGTVFLRRGCSCTKGSSLNDQGAGRRERRFNYASESIRSGTRSHHRHTESCKPNKTKQNKTKQNKTIYHPTFLSLHPPLEIGSEEHPQTRRTDVLFCFVWLATLGMPVVAPGTAAGTFRRVVEAP